MTVEERLRAVVDAFAAEDITVEIVNGIPLVRPAAVPTIEAKKKAIEVAHGLGLSAIIADAGMWLAP